MKILILLLLIASSTSWAVDWQKQFIASLKNGSILVKNGQGRIILEHRTDESFIPASTIKIATAACALHELGSHYHFKTEFFLTPQNILAVKGYGDPLLVSEEIVKIAQSLKRKGLSTIEGIVLDASYFDPQIVIDGASQSTNPYDALNSALLANFNTISVKKFKNGKIVSAEAQTPLTPIALQAGKKLRAGTHRINLAFDRDRSIRYVGELLKTFLEKEGVQVNGEITPGVVPQDASLFYTHYNSLPLTEVLRGLLEFSTNLTSNQLFLVMGAKKLGAPATVEKGVRVLTQFLNQQMGWSHFHIEEGSGLSRKNRVTARQMMKLLDYFEPYRDLLPIKDHFFQAKTGTLNGVNTYAGYFSLPNGNDIKFVMLINDQVPYEYKFQLAKKLYDNLVKLQ